MPKTLALFDFDGTITTKDSMFDFLIFSFGKPALFAGLIATSPYLIAHKVRLLGNTKAKEKFLAHFLKGKYENLLRQKAKDYADRIDDIIRPQAKERLQWHKDHGHDIAIVSASLDIWVQPWCDAWHLPLLSSKWAFAEGVAGAKLDSPNCYGQAKVNAVKQYFDLTTYEKVYAYGDSRGDKELLELADEGFYKPFRGSISP